MLYGNRKKNPDPVITLIYIEEIGKLKIADRKCSLRIGELLNNFRNDRSFLEILGNARRNMDCPQRILGNQFGRWLWNL